VLSFPVAIVRIDFGVAKYDSNLAIRSGFQNRCGHLRTVLLKVLQSGIKLGDLCIAWANWGKRGKETAQSTIVRKKPQVLCPIFMSLRLSSKQQFLEA
jgi:hypothetical protein